MPEALIIDACRTPRGIGKQGKGSLAHLHPHHLGRTVLEALVDRTGIDTADVDDVVWGTSSQVGQQSGDLGRMTALDAGFDVRASGMTLDRFCGSGITANNIAANAIMAGMEDLVIGGGTEMMSLPKKGLMPMGSGNAHLQEIHPQSHQGVCADAIATLYDKSLITVRNLDGTVALDHEEFPRSQTTAESLAALAASGRAGLLPADLRRRCGSGAHGERELRQGPRFEGSSPRGGHVQHGRRPHAHAQRPGARGPQGARAGRTHARRHRPVRSERSLRGGRRERCSSPRCSTSWNAPTVSSASSPCAAVAAWPPPSSSSASESEPAAASRRLRHGATPRRRRAGRSRCGRVGRGRCRGRSRRTERVGRFLRATRP